MKILIFGGTFNPPHLGHQLMAEQVLARSLSDGQSFDQLWFLPVGQHSFAKKFVDKKHRLVMLDLMIAALQEKGVNKNKILVETYEIDRDEESQTFATLEFLAKKYPEHNFSFLIGSDNLSKFNLWHDYQKMLEKYPFYVYPRSGFPFTPIYKGMIALADFPKMEVSSTKVREALTEKSSLKGLLNDKVISYIRDNKLYVPNQIS